MTNERYRRPFFVVPDAADAGPEDGIPPEELQALGVDLLRSVPRYFKNEPQVEAQSRNGAPFSLSYLSGRTQDTPAFWTRFAAVRNRISTPKGTHLVLATYFMDEVGMTAQPSVHRCIVTETDDAELFVASYTFGQDAVTPNALVEANEWLERDQEEILLPHTMTAEEKLHLPPVDGAKYVRWSLQRTKSLLDAYSIQQYQPTESRSRRRWFRNKS